MVSTDPGMELRQVYVGCLPYAPDYEADGHTLLIAIECSIGEAPEQVMALLDCAAEWSVLPRGGAAVSHR